MRGNAIASLCGLGLVGLLCSGALAGVANPSFETEGMAGWTLVASGGWGAGGFIADTAADNDPSNPNRPQYPNFGNPLPGTADGTHYADIAGNSGNLTWLFQDVGQLQPNTTYTLTIAIGVGKYDYAPSAGKIVLVNGTDQTGTWLSSADTASLNMGMYANNFKDLTASVTTGGEVAGHLVVAIGGDGFPGNSLKFDNVRLVATAVPEPAMMGLGLFACGLVSLRRRRMV